MKAMTTKWKLFAVSILMIVGSFSAFAQDAKTMLNEVSSKVKSYNNITIDFKYNLHNSKEGVNQDARGDVILSGNKYLLNMMGSTTLFDGKKMYTIVPEDEEITISTQNPGDDDAITPSKMLTFFNEGYTYKWDIEQNVSGRKIQYVKLVPMDSNSELKSALLGIDAQTKHIYRLIMTQNNGSKITITVNTFKTDQPLPGNLFTFDASKYSDYYINELD